MKKLLYVTALAVLFFSCSVENLQDEKSVDPNFRVFEYTPKGGNSFTGDKIVEGEEWCFDKVLVAGQNYEAGKVSVFKTPNDIIIKYTTNDDWSIKATHMSLGECFQTIPTTGSENPQIGKFEHSSSHSNTVNEVVYMVSLDVFKEISEDDPYYCFAAHAVVSGPNGTETAWAEGDEFEGRSWAMYVQALRNDCIIISPDTE